MWPLYPLSNKIISITITPEYLSCCWIEKTNTKYYLKAYSKQQLIQYEIIDIILCNPSSIKRYILQFLHDNNVYNAYVVFACENKKNTIPRELIMQYQLLVLSIPLNCIMITSCISAITTAQHYIHSLKLSDTFNKLKKEDILQNIGLYLMGKKIYEQTE